MVSAPLAPNALERLLEQAAREIPRLKLTRFGRSITRPVQPMVFLLPRWFLAHGAVLQAHFAPGKPSPLLRNTYSHPELEILEQGFSAITPRDAPHLLKIEMPEVEPTARVVLEFARYGNRAYTVTLVDVSRFQDGQWRRVRFNPEAPQPGEFHREFLMVRELLLDASTSVFRTRQSVVADQILGAYGFRFLVDEETADLSLKVARFRLRVYSLPRGTSAKLSVPQNAHHMVRVSVLFSPPLSPGQAADFVLLLRRRNAKPFTLEDVRARRLAGSYNHDDDVAPACEIGVDTPLDRLDVTTILPRGYVPTNPTLDVEHARTHQQDDEEARRIRDAGAVRSFVNRGRHHLQLVVERPKLDRIYLSFYRPPTWSALPESLRPSMPYTTRI